MNNVLYGWVANGYVALDVEDNGEGAKVVANMLTTALPEDSHAYITVHVIDVKPTQPK